MVHFAVKKSATCRAMSALAENRKHLLVLSLTGYDPERKWEFKGRTDQILSKPPPAATKPPVTHSESIAPCCSIGATPGPLVLMPPAISISRAEPPGLMLRPIAESVITTPLTSD